MKPFIASVFTAAALTVAAVPAFAQRTVHLGDGPTSTIGVAIQDLTPQGAESAKVDQGVVIQRVEDGSPAARAGLMTGDVIVEFDGEPVRSVRQFTRLVQETRPDRRVDTIVVRKGTRQTLQVTPQLGRAATFSLVSPGWNPAPLADSVPFSPNLNIVPRNGWFAPAGGQLGAAVMALDDQLASYFGVTEGVLVTSVSADSPAARAGLKAGDVIVEVEGRRVAEPGEVADAVRAVSRGDEIDIRVVREKADVQLKAVVPQPNAPRVLRNRETI